MKRILLLIAAVLVLAVVGVGGAIMSAFRGLQPAKDGATLGDGVTQVLDGYVSAFIVPAGEGQAVLIDCAQDPDAKALKAALEQQHRTVLAVFLTHGHGDHMGGCKAFPDAPVFAFEGDRGLIEGTAAAHGPITRFAKGDPAKSPKVTRALADGETVQVGEASVRAFAVPGHTAGSAAYLAAGVLFLGDAVTGQADGQVRNAPWVFSDDTDECKQSVSALAKRLEAEHAEVKTLAFAHSGPLEGLAPLLSFANAK